MSNVQNILNQAVELLKANPLDAGHDLSHHERVVRLALEIADKIGQDVDTDVLKIASMWHDVQLRSSEVLAVYLQGRLEQDGFEKSFVNKVIESIETHSFDKNPSLVEAQILYDADKLDALSLERGRRIAKSLMNKTMSASRKQIYIRVGKAWIKEMRAKLHFDFTRNLYDEKVKMLLASEEVDTLAKKLGIDIDDVKAQLHQNLSWKDKFIIFVTNIFR